ncbi:nitroreductase family protein [Streptomyces sp. b94]|uniref:nitroreductase family protein n=1 Tax=Streptomyces sp. b94 TaxID=1827634 RepID=UPI001FFD3CBC|nr:nitroreductase family protein [Streptomyces sp. b94]
MTYRTTQSGQLGPLSNAGKEQVSRGPEGVGRTADGRDIGMYAQNFLLSLASRRFAGIPRAMLGFSADAVRAFLDVPENLKLLFGISLGTADPAAPGNVFGGTRIPLIGGGHRRGDLPRCRHLGQ